MLPAANPFIGVSPQAYSPTRITKSTIIFDVFDYKSDFQLNKKIKANTLVLSEPNVIFKETIKFNNKKKAIVNEHELYMSNQNSILAAARDVGFILAAHVDSFDIENIQAELKQYPKLVNQLRDLQSGGYSPSEK